LILIGLIVSIVLYFIPREFIVAHILFSNNERDNQISTEQTVLISPSPQPAIYTIESNSQPSNTETENTPTQNAEYVYLPESAPYTPDSYINQSPNVVSLLDLSTFTQSHYFINFRRGDGRNYRDNLGNADYERGLSFSARGRSPQTGEFTYLLNGEYTSLRGTLAVEYSSRNLTSEGTFMRMSLYGDGRLLYQFQEMRGGVRPIEFAIDIKEVDKLRFFIDMAANTDLGLGTPFNVLMLDPQLTKNQ